MSYEAVDSFFPEWNIWMEFLVGTVETLRLDSMTGTHPIEVITLLVNVSWHVMWFNCYEFHMAWNNVSTHIIYGVTILLLKYKNMVIFHFDNSK